MVGKFRRWPLLGSAVLLLGWVGLWASPPFRLDPDPVVDQQLKKDLERQGKPLRVRRPPDLHTLTQNRLLRSGLQFTAPYGAFSEQMLPASNRLNLMVVPVNFGDTNLVITSNELAQLFNGPAYSSFSNYYAIQSSGLFAPNAVVLSPITLAQGRAAYNLVSDDFYTNFLWQALAKVTNQLSSWSPSVISSTFDANNDGFVDGILFIHAGEGAETSGSSGDIHSHQFSLYFHGTESVGFGNAASGPRAGSLYFGRYLISPEMQNPKASAVFQRSTIGTHVHEFGHMLGFVDLYNTQDGNDFVLYDGELMSGGSYNYVPTNFEFYVYGGSNKIVFGKYPAPLSGYHKSLLKWMTPTELFRDPKTSFPLSNFVASNGSTGALVKARGRSDSEYWLVENRVYGVSTDVNFDRGLYGQGMLIWRVNSNVIGAPNSHYFSEAGINNDTNKRGLSLEPFRKTLYDTFYNWTMYAFWSNSAAGFGTGTIPSSAYKSTTGASGVTLSNISAIGAVMNFDFQGIPFDAMATNMAVIFPNPYIPTAGSLVLSISDASAVKTLQIITADGRLVKDFSSDLTGAFRSVGNRNQYIVSWNGKDISDRPVTPGIYWVRLVQVDGAMRLAGRFYVRF